MRRISSFNEPMDRYRRLFESTFNTEAKQHISERIKLRTEETTSPSNTGKNPLGRILSMPDIRSNCYFQSEDSPDANSVGTPTRNDLNSDVGVDTIRVDGRKTSCVSQSLENEDLSELLLKRVVRKNRLELVYQIFLLKTRWDQDHSHMRKQKVKWV